MSIMTTRIRIRSRCKQMPNGCLEWQGPRDSFGYGKVGRYNVHRVAYARAKGDPADFFVCHSCDNPACCNPEHLWLGTVGDNNRDMVAKGRHGFQCRTHCKNGHKFTPENTYREPGRNRRTCRACNRAAAARYAAKKRSRA